MNWARQLRLDRKGTNTYRCAWHARIAIVGRPPNAQLVHANMGGYVTGLVGVRVHSYTTELWLRQCLLECLEGLGCKAGGEA